MPESPRLLLITPKASTNTRILAMTSMERRATVGQLHLPGFHHVRCPKRGSDGRNLHMHRWSCGLILLSLAAIASADRPSGKPDAISTSDLIVPHPFSTARAVSAKPPVRGIHGHRKRRLTCSGCSAWIYSYTGVSRSETHENRDSALGGTRYIRQARPTFGPIIRRDACAPKIYVQSPETGRFKTYCGSSEFLAAEAASNR